MDIRSIQQEGRRIWGSRKMALPAIIVAMGKVFGDLCRFARNAPKDKATHTDAELKKELGNMIVSTIRWCDDLGYDVEECIARAIEAQKKFPKHGTNTPQTAHRKIR